MRQRKTKDVYRLVWNSEVIDTFDTLKEARAMRAEYEMAFNSCVTIKKGREVL